MNFNTIFFNKFGRLRSGWRFAFFLLSFIFLGVLLGSFVLSLLGSFSISVEKGSLGYILVNSGVSFVAALVIGWFCGKTFEDLPFRALGFAFTKNWLKDFILGFAIGALTILLAILIAYVFGGLSFKFNQSHGTAGILLTLATSFAVLAIAAAFEEALFRGYILQTFSRAGLAWLAIILTSVFFSLVHLNNDGANYLSSLNTGLAGIWFGVAYLKTRNLWFPFSLHLIWNWLMGAFFGIEISGMKNLITAPVMREIDSGPTWLTGTDYGIEGGIACTIAILASTALIYFLPFFKPSEEMIAFSSREQPVESRSA